jgi:hypothetical protein
MDLESAFQKHAGWIEEFCAAIFNKDTVDVGAYAQDDCCELGKWLYGDGKAKYGEMKAYADLVSAHAAFHQEAGKVAQTINEKNYAKAEELFGADGEYAAASHAVRAAIKKLREETHH